MDGRKRRKILMVEDNQADARLAIEAFKENQLDDQFFIVNDGIDAMAFLKREGTHRDAPRPDLILLDLNMPRKNGREVLVEIKRDPKLKHIPVVILTTSSAPEDVAFCYDARANCFVGKPAEFLDLLGAVKLIDHFWFNVVSLPAGAQPN